MNLKIENKQLVFLILLSFSHFIFSQNNTDNTKTLKPLPKTHWYNGSGVYVFGTYQLGAINVQRNPFSQTLFSGWSGGIVVKGKNNPHLLIEYGTTLKTNLSLDWVDIKEQHVNVNALFDAYATDNNQLIAILGITYKQLDGFYTGKLKTNEYTKLYASNTKISNSWLGLNTGLGYEFNIAPFSVFGLVEIPVVWSDLGFGINDFIIKVGLKQKIPFKAIFKKSKDRYHWF
jgi:hypothetical protein